MSKSPPSSSKRSGGRHANCRPLRPPLVIVQVFLERLSSPWESHFDTTNAVQIRFFPFSSSSDTAAAAADGHLSVGNGRLFIMRQDQIGWLQLDIGRADGEGANGGWRGRLKLVEEGTQTTEAATAPMCRRIACELRSIEHGREDGAALPLMLSSSSLTAHLLVSVDEVRKRREERGGHVAEQKKEEGGDQRKRAEDGWAQTEGEEAAADGTSRRQEIGVQTVKEAQATEATATAEEKQRGQRWRRATAARVMMLMMAALNGSAQAAAAAKGNNDGRRRTMAMMIGGRRGREVIGATTTTTIGRPTKERETMTRVSIPPNANSPIRPHPNQSVLISQYRAQIAYLSAVHRTLVPQTAGNERKRRKKTLGGRRERKTEDDDGIRAEGWRGKEEQQPEERMGRTRTDVEEGWMKSVKWWEGGRERMNGRDDDEEGSSILQSVAISESDGSVAADERTMRGTAPEGMNGRMMATDYERDIRRTAPEGMNARMMATERDIRRTAPEGMNGRMMATERHIRRTAPEGMNARIMAGLGAIRRTAPEEMNGRIIPDEVTKRVTPEGMNGRIVPDKGTKGGTTPKRVTPEGMNGRIIANERDITRTAPEGMNGRAKSRSASKGTSASSSASSDSSSAPTRKKSIASSSSSSSSSKRSSSSSVSCSSTPTASSPSTKGSSDYQQQQKLAESPTNSSTLKGSSAKTESSIATDISKSRPKGSPSTIHQQRIGAAHILHKPCATTFFQQIFCHRLQRRRPIATNSSATCTLKDQ
uniref:SH3 domain-containing protein n=1 Tax=Globodera rostochiensis TaxID=31243 RepID=A0A914GXY8_GLORO